MHRNNALWRQWVLSLTALVWLAGARPAAAAIFISGRLLSDGPHLPLAGVTITLHRGALPTATPSVPMAEQDAASGEDASLVATAQSMPNGAYVLRATEPGRYHIAINDPDYDPLTLPVTIPARGIPWLPLTLHGKPALVIKLLDARGRPVTTGIIGVRAWVTGPKRMPFARLYRGSVSRDGRLHVPLAELAGPTGPRQTLLEVRSESSGCAEARLGDWPPHPFSLRLNRGAVLSGRVLDGAGKAVPGAALTCAPLFANGEPMPAEAILTTESSHDGSFSIANVLPGLYAVHADIPGTGARAAIARVATGTVPIVIDPAQHEWAVNDIYPAAYSPAPPSEVLARVRAADQPPASFLPIWGCVEEKSFDARVNSVTVELFSPGGTTPVSRAATLNNGTYLLHAPGPGHYRIVIRSKDYEPFEQEVDVKSPGTALDLKLSWKSAF